MRHSVKKIKFAKGKNATVALIRKLSVNFLKKGKITTTLKKAKVLKPIIERLVEKAKKKTEANKNLLLKYLANWQLVESMFGHVGPAFTTRIGGYVRLVRLGVVGADGNERARMEWTNPIIMKEKKINDDTIKKTPKEQVKRVKNPSK